MKTGRNSPCPCGSGKKYKKCCLNKNSVIPAADLAYRRISKVYRELELKLEKYMFKLFDEEIIYDAIGEFFCWPDEETNYFNDDALESMQDLYRPWLLYNWDCGQDMDETEDLNDIPVTVAEAYLKKNSKKISETEKNLILSISREPYCFWDVTGVQPGKTIDLKNIMSGKTITVQERMASESLQAKNIVFARVVAVDDVCMIVGMGRTIIPPGFKSGLIELRQDMREEWPEINDEALQDWAMDMREEYLSIDWHLRSPPKMQNTDGDPLELHKLIFEINDPEFALKKLASLCTEESLEDIKKNAKTDAKGLIQKVNFPWTKKGNKKNAYYTNTILGEITIENKKMTVQVNSAERARHIKKEIKTRMGNEARFKVDVIEDMEAAMSRLDEDSFDSKKIQKEHDALMAKPEVRQKFEEMILKHWDEWMDMKIPALGNKTPRKAVKTSDGREAVEALLDDIERGKTADPILNELQKQGSQKVRKELGLE